LPPNIKRRQISSIIKVRDGDHAILGGLITKGKGTNTEGVPILGDIPILGYAFKREQVLDYTDELVIIITPHIIKNNKNVSLKEMGYKTLR
jgi:general secretion pathway protein D